MSQPRYFWALASSRRGAGFVWSACPGFWSGRGPGLRKARSCLNQNVGLLSLWADAHVSLGPGSVYLSGRSPCSRGCRSARFRESRRLIRGCAQGGNPPCERGPEHTAILLSCKVFFGIFRGFPPTPVRGLHGWAGNARQTGFSPGFCVPRAPFFVTPPTRGRQTEDPRHPGTEPQD